MNKTTAVALFGSAALATAFTLPITQPAGTVSGRVLFSGAMPAASGKVVFDGEKPEVKPLAIDAEKSKGCAAAGASVDTTNPSLIIGANGGIANVVVMVEVAGTPVKAPDKPVVLDQKTCRFEPHVTIVPVGTTVEFLNSDGVSHNVHTYPGKNEAFNQTIGAGSKETRKLDKEDTIEIKCDIHPWMNAWLHVANTNFYAVTGADGSFTIEGLPPGEHKAKLRHETLGKAEATIKVGADGKAEPVEVKMNAEKKGGGRKR